MKKILFFIGSNVNHNEITQSIKHANLLSSYDLALFIKKPVPKELSHFKKIFSYSSSINPVAAFCLDFFNGCKFLNQNKMDFLFHFSNPKRNGLLVLVLGKLFKCSSVTRISGDVFSTYKQYSKLLRKLSSFLGSYLAWTAFKYSDHVVYIGDYLKYELIKKNISINKIHYIPQTINKNLFYPVLNIENKNSLREKMGLPSENKNLLFVGRLSYLKGADILYNIMDKLQKKNLSEYHFIIIGDGEYSDIFKKHFKTNISFYRSISNASIADFYRVADLLIFCSRTEGGIPNVILESLTCGTPVVSTAVGCIQSITNNICSSDIEFIDFIVKNDEWPLDHIPNDNKNDTVLKKYEAIFNN